jgi:hypothetical protein
MDPMKMTWDDVEKFVKAAGLDKDEYFHLYTSGGIGHREEALRKTVVWDEKGIRNVAVWWTPGANEGYYLQVDRRLFSESGRGGVDHHVAMLGKFWSPARAAFASDLLVRLFYGLFEDPNELIEAAKKNYEET